jgi:hypothetical protein
MVSGEGPLIAQHLTATRHSNRNYNKSRKIWSQTIHGKFSLFPTYLMTWQKKPLLNCQNIWERHTTGCGTAKIKIEWGDIQVRTWDDLTEILYRDKRIFMKHQQRVISITNRETLWNHSLWRITVTWLMWIRETGWLTAAPTAIAHGIGQRNYSASANLAILDSYIVTQHSHVVTWKFHTEIFDLPLSGIDWHMLDNNWVQKP